MWLKRAESGARLTAGIGRVAAGCGRRAMSGLRAWRGVHLPDLNRCVVYRPDQSHSIDLDGTFERRRLELAIVVTDPELNWRQFNADIATGMLRP